MSLRSATKRLVKKLPDVLRSWLVAQKELSLSDAQVKMLLELKFSPKSLKDIIKGWDVQGLDIDLGEWIEIRYQAKTGKTPPTGALAVETPLVQAWTQRLSRRQRRREKKKQQTADA